MMPNDPLGIFRSVAEGTVNHKASKKSRLVNYYYSSKDPFGGNLTHPEAWKGDEQNVASGIWKSKTKKNLSPFLQSIVEIYACNFTDKTRMPIEKDASNMSLK